MAKLLSIESSPRKKRSKSISTANVFLDAYRDSHPDDEIVTLDLWDRTLPEFNDFALDAKYQVMHGQEFTDPQRDAWQTIVDLCEEFKSADKYVISLPMWNFGIPYKLKHYIDLIAQPGQTFTFDPATGYTGLVTGKPITVIYSRGGAYGNEQAKAMDLQKGYMDLVLGFLGFTDVQSILVEPTLGAPDAVASVEAAAAEQARELAAKI
ncbi:FMN-dependent NADH-azoreductase [Rhodopirellula sp. MGV]|uniref:FMN-dependent NADH-azoreductase n=1 Tax=Rhodopirellula sp. MGV TaxID=2023130 RepID=UPI000B96DD86|nr:NAD(P)H-dependent oxidoreductase [Rhodopirellula sp. MGV]OYP30479.1 FMN-dependent NADH-azoreductase [Rhodopirellula sp. MGV]PNY33547.1 FMN-dependent NADH-azoreductase [Rhodopirellula baltica]